MVLYRLKDWEQKSVEMDMVQLNAHVMRFVFNQDMKKKGLVYVTDGKNQQITPKSIQWGLDDEERISNLTVTFNQDLQPGDIVHLSGLRATFSEKSFAENVEVVSLQQEGIIPIDFVEIIDPTTFKLKLNQQVESAFLELINVEINSVNQFINRSVKVHSLYVNPETPYIIQGILAPKNAFKANTDYLFHVTGTLYDKALAGIPVKQELSFNTAEVGRVKYSIEKAQFLDEKHIMCTFTHPTVLYSNVEDNLKVIYDPEGRDDQLKVSKIEAWNDYVWIIGLDESSNMYDVFIDIENVYDATGRYSINTRERIVGPWD
jgi:hypothetical protein